MELSTDLPRTLRDYDSLPGPPGHKLRPNVAFARTAAPTPRPERKRTCRNCGRAIEHMSAKARNAMKRHVRPAAGKLGITLSGWHDLRHSLVTQLRKSGWAAKAVSEIVGHSTPHITEAIYDHADRDDFRAALDEMAGQLFRDVPKFGSFAAGSKSQAVN